MRVIVPLQLQPECDCSEISKQGVATRSPLSGHPGFLVTSSGHPAHEAEHTVVSHLLNSAYMFISNEAPTPSRVRADMHSITFLQQILLARS